MRLDFATATRIIFGAGSVAEVPAAAAEMGHRALLVTGGKTANIPVGLTALASARLMVATEPTVELVRSGIRLARGAGCDYVIAAGGGSVLDTGKAVAALLTNPGDPLNYLEVIGEGHQLMHPAAPCIAIPTTAGTGSEVTRNAVLASPEHRVKASLRSPSMLPRLAVIDPDLTAGLPRHLTASTGLDALTQLIEPFVSSKANIMTDMFCREGLRRAAIALPRVWDNGRDRDARSSMAWAALLGGLALANSGLGAVHGFAAPIGGMFAAPHGAVCAALLPHATEVNIRALREREPESPALERYTEVARLLTGHAECRAEDGVEWLGHLVRMLKILPLRAYGVTGSDIPVLIDKASRASSMKGNPIVLTPAELQAIVAAAI